MQSSGHSVPTVYASNTVEMTSLAHKQHGKMKAADMKDAVLPEEKTLLSLRYLKTGLVYKMKRSLKQNTDGF